jgi:hypothetical protein
MMRVIAPICVVSLVGWYFFSGGCTDPFLHIPSIDGFILNEPASRSDVDLAAVLAQHDHDALMMYKTAGAVGPPKKVTGPDGIRYAFTPDASSADIERTLVTLYPAPMAHAIANNLPVTDMLVEDRVYVGMIAAGIPEKEAAQARDLSLGRVYRKAFAKAQEKIEREHQEALAKRKPLLTTTIEQRIAAARRIQRSTCVSAIDRFRSLILGL